MSDHAIERDRLADLRLRAASRLSGPAAAKGAADRAADALTVLHSLASSPATASDALALLHELQVHQVELDLQAQELRESRADLEGALRRQRELYNFQPVGCFTIDTRLALHEINQTAAGMLGIGLDEADGSALEAFLCTDSTRRLRSAIASVDAGVPASPCRLTLRPMGRPERQVIASIAADPAGSGLLVSLTDAGDDPSGRSAAA